MVCTKKKKNSINQESGKTQKEKKKVTTGVKKLKIANGRDLFQFLYNIETHCARLGIDAFYVPQKGIPQQQQPQQQQQQQPKKRPLNQPVTTNKKGKTTKSAKQTKPTH